LQLMQAGRALQGLARPLPTFCTFADGLITSTRQTPPEI
jgi:hypothetical protein